MSSKPVDEFNTNVPDKEERKRLRRKRIDKNSATENANNEDIEEKDNGVSKSGGQQVVDSLFNIDQRKHSGLQNVTAIRVKTNDTESKRRIEDEDFRKSRLAKLQQEALGSAKANAAIEMKWAELLENDIPQELHQDIQLQMDACKTIIKSKDELISDFQQQLRSKDEEYVRSLRQQAEDVDDLLFRIRREFKELQQEYEKELDTIEEAYLEERERIISEHTGEIDGMFEHRRNKEVYYKETKQTTEERYQQEMEELITKGADQYNKLKIELEMNIQALKQQLEEIRATYQLNTEKLDYNYRVLTELDVEKNAELSRYKRRLNKLKGQLNVLVSRFTEMEAVDSRTNHDLTEDYRSLTIKYKDLQAKFRHFEIADTTKYDEVWTMHEEEVKDLVDQLLKADKIISEQQIGWLWKAPDMLALQKVLGRHGGLGLTDANANSTENSTVQEEGTEVIDGDEDDPDREEQLKLAEKNKKVAGARVRAVLKMLATEAGFMLNPIVQESIANLPDGEAEVSRAENMLKALGVKTEERLNTLVNYFFKEASDEVKKFDGSADGEDEYESELILITNAPEDVVNLKNMIKPEDVIAAVKTYIEDVSAEGTGVPTGGVGGKATQEEIRIAQKRLASMRNYWYQLSQVVSDDSVEVWKQLEKDYMNLREMLSRRSATVAEVDALARQNAELKSLLNQYLGDTVTNSAFRVPPAQVMKVRDLTSTFNTTSGKSGMFGSSGFSKPGSKAGHNKFTKGFNSTN